jgi:hypothetical protein
MRISFRMNILRLTIFFMVSETQVLEGVTSKVVTEPEEKHLHYIFFDLDCGSLEEVMQLLGEIQREFRLGDIYIVSDREGSYRAWCWSVRPWITYMHILIHALEAELLDYGFWVWTVRRGAATLRTSNKVGRSQQKCVAMLKGYESTVIPEKLEHVLYDTGIEKKGWLIELGQVS